MISILAAAAKAATTGAGANTMNGVGETVKIVSQNTVPKQVGNVVSPDQAVMDLKTGKLLPDDIRVFESLPQQNEHLRPIETQDIDKQHGPAAKETIDTPSVAEVQKVAPIRYDLLTRNQALEGDVHPVTGVPFERKTIVDANGNLPTGVFPRFESSFDAQLPNDMLKVSDKEQFTECNRQLQEHISKNPDMSKALSSEQVDQIRNGDTPDGFTWHHNEEMGKMQLVKSDVHALTGHTGGRTIWAGGSEFRA